MPILARRDIFNGTARAKKKKKMKKKEEKTLVFYSEWVTHKSQNNAATEAIWAHTQPTTFLLQHACPPVRSISNSYFYLQLFSSSFFRQHMNATTTTTVAVYEAFPFVCGTLCPAFVD